MSRLQCLGLWCVLGLLAVSTTDAQVLGDFERSRFSPAAYFNYSESGDVTMLLHVWGTVRHPGLYEVPQSTRLNTLFSLAGGPNVLTNRRRDRRSVIVTLSRLQGGTPVVIYQETMEDTVSATAQDPMLREGDVLTVEVITEQRFSWRDVVSITNTFGVLALAVSRLFVN